MKYKKRVLFLLVALLLAWLFFKLWQPEPVEVKLHTLARGLVESTVANTRAGTVRACQRSRLSMSTGGTVTALLVKAGDRVEKGDLLLQLRDSEYLAALEQAQARLRAAEQKKAEVCFRAEQDQREKSRQETLYEKRLASEESLDRIRTVARMSSLSCKAAQAQIDESSAAVRLAAANLEQTRLLAPFAGIVAEVNGELGEYVTPSPPGVPTPPAIDLIDDTCLYVRAPIDEVDTAKIRVGMPARVTLDAFRGQSLEARVTRISPYVQDYEKQARTVDVEANLTQVPEGLTLLVGYSADLEIILEQRGNVVRVPTEMLLEGNRVLRLNALDNRLEQVSFTVGLSNWVYTEAVDGLSEGDRILAELDAEGAVDGAIVLPVQ
jgi:HlyD family secretion protein